MLIGGGVKRSNGDSFGFLMVLHHVMGGGGEVGVVLENIHPDHAVPIAAHRFHVLLLASEWRVLPTARRCPRLNPGNATV